MTRRWKEKKEAGSKYPHLEWPDFALMTNKAADLEHICAKLSE